ncbi:GAF domain-containing protein [Cognatilysobacter bugurensis]|uniref:GAF domain-containing protein n=1 Tax=Cognatilysobacter bugurensis TaxID=543356 RepID=A0A918SZP4_9GAMM|nr:GAF domain-containing protein [Lysobacter bugurensis]GHA80154.1 hypothetical protein GCM10007067_17290 [Lysobacter bugurensis]
MKIAPLHDREAERLAALHASGAIGAGDEEPFSRFARIARAFADTPVAAISLVDANRQWFRGCAGQWLRESPRSVSFCAHALHEREMLYVPDASADERFRDNPIVTGAPHVRFYAGFPLYLGDGLPIGALCVIDHRPREFNAGQLARLRDLADCLQRELAVQALLREVGSLRRSRAMQALAPLH